MKRCKHKANNNLAQDRRTINREQTNKVEGRTGVAECADKLLPLKSAQNENSVHFYLVYFTLTY